MRSAIDYALADVAAGLRETDGRNRGPQIDRMSRFVGIPLGSPYCAAGVSWCFHRFAQEAGGPGVRFPYAGGSQFLKAWFRGHGLLSEDPQDLLGWDGALFGWTLPGGRHGHIGFVKRRLTAAGRVVAIETAEYNTSPAGGRDGEGAFSLRRVVPVDRGHRLYFMDTTPIIGGRWWS